MINKITFTWDESKARTNFIKHKVSFDEAKTVFEDENARLLLDCKKIYKSRTKTIQGVFTMRKEYDFSNSIQNPYTQKVKKQISINIEVDTIDYFKTLAKKVGIPYQSLINSYLSDCAEKHVEPKVQWN